MRSRAAFGHTAWYSQTCALSCYFMAEKMKSSHPIWNWNKRTGATAYRQFDRCCVLFQHLVGLASTSPGAVELTFIMYPSNSGYYKSSVDSNYAIPSICRNQHIVSSPHQEELNRPGFSGDILLCVMPPWRVAPVDGNTPARTQLAECRRLVPEGAGW